MNLLFQENRQVENKFELKNVFRKEKRRFLEQSEKYN